jgi:hypothetical protein
VVMRLREVMLAALRRFIDAGEVPADDSAIRWNGIVGEIRSLPVDAPWDTIEIYAEAAPVAVG